MPRRRLTTAGGQVLLDDVVVVALADGRLGLAAPAAAAQRLQTQPRVVVEDPSGAVPAVVGTARVVRSGPAYEEVRGRTRREVGVVQRWRLRRDGAVVLVEPDGP